MSLGQRGLARSVNIPGVADRNFVFVGGTGSGKSEIVVNLCLRLAEMEEREAPFFGLAHRLGDL